MCNAFSWFMIHIRTTYIYTHTHTHKIPNSSAEWLIDDVNIREDIRNMYKLPEFWRVIWDGFGSFKDGERIGVEEKIFKLAHVSIAANIFATIAKRTSRSSSVLFRGWFWEKMSSFLLHSGYDLLTDPMIRNFEESIFFTCPYDQFRYVWPIKREINSRNSKGLRFFGSCWSWRRNYHSCL